MKWLTPRANEVTDDRASIINAVKAALVGRRRGGKRSKHPDADTLEHDAANDDGDDDGDE